MPHSGIIDWNSPIVGGGEAGHKSAILEKQIKQIFNKCHNEAGGSCSLGSHLHPRQSRDFLLSSITLMPTMKNGDNNKKMSWAGLNNQNHPASLAIIIIVIINVVSNPLVASSSEGNDDIIIINSLVTWCLDGLVLCDFFKDFLLLLRFFIGSICCFCFIDFELMTVGNSAERNIVGHDEAD